MKSVSISGSLRENVGKKDAKAQRVQGMIPCALYGGKEQKLFVVDEKQFQKLLYTPEVNYVDLDINDGYSLTIGYMETWLERKYWGDRRKEEEW